MAERISSNEAQKNPNSELRWDPNVNIIPVSDMGYTHSNRIPAIAKSESPRGVRQELKMLIEAGDQTFALSEVQTESGKMVRAIALVGKEDGDPAQLLDFFDSDWQGSTITIGRSFDARGLFGEDAHLSREHFSVTWGDERIRVDDLESTNGTFVGAPLREAIAPKDSSQGVVVRGVKRLIGRRKKQEQALPEQTPLSEGYRWSVSGDEILKGLGE